MTIGRPMTAAQARVYDFLRRYLAEHRRMPSIREIGAEMGVRSPNGVVCHLKALRAKGRIEWDENQARSIRLTAAGACPCCGGTGVAAEDQEES